ncbi:MAG: hypothetical protein JNL43_04445 [Flavobacteriales bacterium]|nr:hypothetical protein [Flavobacteriales bacterium]
MKTRTTILSFLSMAMGIAEMSGQGVLAPTLISATNAFPEGGTPEKFCTRGDSYINFTASVLGPNGRQVWRTDGTTASTRDISIAPNGVCGLASTPSMLYYSEFGSNGPAIRYASDGSLSSPQIIPPVIGTWCKLSAGSTLGNNYVFLGSSRWLYRTNGTSALVLLKTFDNIGETLCTWNGKVFFTAAASGTDMELWVTDGTAAGTVLVKDIFPGTGGSDPQNLQVVGNRLYFTAVSRSGGKRELWSSSGLGFNTMKVKEIGKMTGKFVALDPASLAFPQKFYFIVSSTASDAVWESDGTPEGTKKLSLPLASVSKMELFPIVGGSVQFIGRDIAGNSHIYRITFYTNSAMAPTTSIECSLPPGTSGTVVGLCNGKLFYTSGSNESKKLWALVTGGPREVRPSNAQASWKLANSSGNFSIQGNWLYFSADASGGGYELYKVQ